MTTMKTNLMIGAWISLPIVLLGADRQDYVIKSTANLVVLDVSVTAPDGGPVSGLTRNRFVIAEDGRKQEIKQFSAADSPVSMGLVLDMSGSMGPKAASVMRAVSLLVEASSPQDQYFVTGFNDRPRLALPPSIPFTSNPTDIQNAMAAFRCEGRTAIYDGIAAALDHIRDSKYERRVLVLVSDGKDTASKMSHGTLVDLVRSTQTTIFTVGLYPDDPLDEHDGQFLKTLARISGGRFYHPASPEALEQSCVRIAKDIRARYTLAYTPHESDKHAVRKIRVELIRTPDDGRRLSVRTRSEYSIGDIKPNTTTSKAIRN